ncbi:response regulator transcription factor [Paracoccus aurantiacus]|uniref:Response regulator transcription factor n=2 Tax=Paracoccus aurantiacus TaxID=2599412 RepID=A0A5C6RZK6_9RHOB|nr:response regulator transcription factor [Paracoccus aurantiacus]
MPSVLLIDDDVELVALLNDYLQQVGFTVATAHDGERALGAIVDARAEIVVLDIMMPRLNGLEVLRRIRRESNIPVLMLTARGDEIDRIAGLDLGADDYLAKPCSPGELAARIRAILRRTNTAAGPQGMVAEGPLTIDQQRRLASWNGQRLLLTGIEFSILEVLVGRMGRPVSRQDLSLQALDRPLAPYDRSLDVHVSAIRQKIGTFDDGRSPIISVRGVGYQFVLE